MIQEQKPVPHALKAITNEGETWEVIQDFPDYRISSYGRVWGFNRAALLKVSKNPRGLQKVNLMMDAEAIGHKSKRVQCTRSVHILVASAFLPEVPGLDYIKFLDGDKGNCKVSNLCRCTKEGPERARWYQVKSVYGETVRFTDISLFCHENSLTRGSFYQLLSGKVNVHRGWMLG